MYSSHRCKSRQIFGGGERFLPEFSQTCPKTHKKVTTKQLCMWFWAPFFSNQSRLGATIAHIFREFAQIFMDFVKVFRDFDQNSTDFQEFCPDFYQIKTFGGASAPSPNRRLLHQWLLQPTHITEKLSPVRKNVRKHRTWGCEGSSW